MRCEVAREALSARIDGERETVPSVRVDEHLAGCPGCTEWYRAAQSFAIPTLDSPVHLVVADSSGRGDRSDGVDSDFLESVLAAMADQQRIEHTEQGSRWWWVAAGAAVVTAGLLVALIMTGSPVVGVLLGVGVVATLGATLAARRDAAREAARMAAALSMARFHLPVTGMHCQGCVQTITTNLTAVPGVAAVEVDLDIRGVSTVRIDADSGVSEAAIAQAISSSGNFGVPR